MIKDILTSLVMFILFFAVNIFLHLKGVMFYLPIVIFSVILGYIGKKWSWTKVLSFCSLFLIIVNLGVINRSINDITSEIFYSWLSELIVANLKIIFSVIVPAYLGWLLKDKLKEAIGVRP